MTTPDPTPGAWPPPDLEAIHDDEGNLVAFGWSAIQEDDGEDDAARLQARIGIHQARNSAARALAPSLIGLDEAQAQQVVEQKPELSVVFRYPDRRSNRTPGRRSGHAAIGVDGQITAYVEEGIVRRAI